MHSGYVKISSSTVHKTRYTSEHRELLDVLGQCKGKVMLSGYPSELYDETLAEWNRHTFDLPNNAAGGKAKGRETEVVWCNF
jgi:DNA adenine methylase